MASSELFKPSFHRPRRPPRLSDEVLFEAFQAVEAATDDPVLREERLRALLKQMHSSALGASDAVLLTWVTHQASTPLSLPSWRQVCDAVPSALWEHAFAHLEHQPALRQVLASALPDLVWIDATRCSLQGTYPCSPACLLAHWRNTDLMGAEGLVRMALEHPDRTCAEALAQTDPGPLHRHWIGALQTLEAGRRAQVFPVIFPALLRRWETMPRHIRERDLDPRVLDSWIGEAAWPGLTPPVIEGFQRTLVVWPTEALPHTVSLFRISQREADLRRRPVASQSLRRRS